MQKHYVFSPFLHDHHCCNGGRYTSCWFGSCKLVLPWSGVCHVRSDGLGAYAAVLVTVAKGVVTNLAAAS